MKSGYTYTMTAAFIVDHELTQDEIDALVLQVAPQIEEPVTAEGEGVEYEIELMSCKINKWLPGERCECNE
jgi:hypothetical protein